MPRLTPVLLSGLLLITACQRRADSAQGTMTRDTGPAQTTAPIQNAATATPQSAVSTPSTTTPNTAESPSTGTSQTTAPAPSGQVATPSAPSGAASTGAGADSAAASTPTNTAVPQGDGNIFPTHRVVAYYGAAHATSTGILGSRPPQQIAELVKARARRYEGYGKPVIPAFELIVTIVTAEPGADRDYSTEKSIDSVRPYVKIAHDEHMLLVLDIQPGRADPLSQVKVYEELLLDPNVGLALDPEWNMGPHELPGQVIGSMSPAKINQVSAYLSKLVQDHHLPQKLFLIHEFSSSMVPNRSEIVSRPGLATVIHADGHGAPALKTQVYGVIHVKQPFYNGFKLFFRQDPDMMNQAQVMKLNPRPDLITYQ